MLNRRFSAILLAGSLTVFMFSPVMAARPTPGSIDVNAIDALTAPQYSPRGISGVKTDVVVRLIRQSVSEVKATIARDLSDSEDQAISNSLNADQESMKGAIRRAGGEVTGQYRYAINGIRVRISSDKLADLAALPNVLEVLPVQKYTLDNSTGVPYIGAPVVWDAGPAPNLHGEGIKVGIIDTGIDYTHANFGGPGTAAAYTTAHATETAPANPALFGPAAPKVKGGYDFVGDAYNADVTGSIPVPDPNPLDCEGHGSHVAGTTAGFGLNNNGTTYAGPYNSSIYTPNAFRIGPGVAPKADLYAYRVFGCVGTTNVVVSAIDRAVQDHMDVINLSLGSSFGTARTADAVAANNAARAGVIVVISAGNSGSNPYIVGSPSTADGAISVAAVDPYSSFAGAILTLSTGPVTAINANGATFANGSSYTVLVVADNPATPVNESLGCNTTDYPVVPVPANTIVVVKRGTCARVHKAIIGQQVGAAAVVMINNSAGLPPFEGVITSDPDTGLAYNVTIPFFGVGITDGPKLTAANGGTLTAVNALIPNPTFSAVAGFSSGGPRIGDSSLKPEISAPGVSIFSTASGSGNLGEYLSGTSMAAPHVAGVAALVKQAHPSWKEKDLKAAIINTGNPAAVAGFSPRSAGVGLVQPYGAVKTSAVATAGDRGVVAMNFGFQELDYDLNLKGDLKVSNLGKSKLTFNVAVTNRSGVPHTLTPLDTSVTIRPNQDVNIGFLLNVPAATAGDSSSFYDAAGIITLTPVDGGNNGVVLRVPYYLVPRPLSDLSAEASSGDKVTKDNPTTTVTVENQQTAAIPGNADFYAWGIRAKRIGGGMSNQVRDVGVQAFQNFFAVGNPLLVFGLNTYNRWSNAAVNEFDIFVDVDPQNNNGDDYVVVGVDYGYVTTGSFTGQFGTFVFSTRSGGANALNPGYSYAPSDSSSASLAIARSYLCRAGEPCLNAANPRFTYHIVSFDITGKADVVPGSASFNALSPSITTGDYFGGIAPGASASTILTINPAEWALTPALGALILTTENGAGVNEALGIPLKLK